REKYRTSWKYKHYFEFCDRKNKNITVKCKLCANSKELSTAVNSTSNLLKHLNRVHSTTKLVTKEDNVTHVTSGQVKRAVAAYVVEEMLPLSTVESQSFRDLLTMIPVTDSSVPLQDRKTFARYLDKCYADMEYELKKTFERLEYVSTTADIWTCNNKSFLGMTAHWINPVNFSREKAALACKRIKGRHKYDVIASEIEQVHSAFGLSFKITATVTDNGSNFLKAFRMYKPAEDTESDSEDELDDDEVTFTDVGQALSSESDGQFTLPPHLSCASHTLNLVSRNDVEKWLTTKSESKTIYRSVIGKCSGLWTKASRSRVASELVEDVIKGKLVVPTATRWNSFHDALSRISQIALTDLNTLCNQMGIKCITEKEYHFLKEYCAILKPLSTALDILQGEDHYYYGTILPTLEVLMSKTLALQSGLSAMTSGLPDAIVKYAMFFFCCCCSVLDSKDALLAAATLPRFKIRWIKDEERRNHVKSLLTVECQQKPSNSNDNDFFVFEDEDVCYSSETQVMEYLKSSGLELDILNKFPNIKVISLKYNTATPSSADFLASDLRNFF
uniref:BED-type domain-containing protein n=1 Tax=Cyprinus carpio TaxID=7962 RepID=A0A8C1KYA6_CYPCA